MTEYRVSIKEISDHPIAEPGGELSHKVEFHIDSSDGVLSADLDGGTMRGEELKRCLQLKEKGYVVVSQPHGWFNHRPERWKEEVVNLALDHSVSESA
jgi:hypothetical protein